MEPITTRFDISVLLFNTKGPFGARWDTINRKLCCHFCSSDQSSTNARRHFPLLSFQVPFGMIRKFTRNYNGGDLN